MHTTRQILLVLAAVLLAACGARGNNAGGGVVVEGRSGTDDINWNSDASHIVFQIDVVGGEITTEELNDIPLCTIYGDNRIVWTPDSQPGQTIVLFDYLDTETVGSFVLDMIINFNIYEYGTRAELQPPGGAPPVYERITMGVNDRVHVTDGFEDWPTDYFRDLLEKCRTLSTRPVTVAPTGGWLSATFEEVDPEATIIIWDEEASGVNLVDLADVSNDATIWVDNELVPIIWNIMTSSPRNRLFEQSDEYFKLAFQVPNLTRDAPPMPAPEDMAAARSLDGIPVEDTETSE